MNDWLEMGDGDWGSGVGYFRSQIVSLFRLSEACANKSCLKAMRWHETGEAFGVRRPGAAFPALESENESLGSNRSFPKCKAEKAAPGRRTPKASPLLSG